MAAPTPPETDGKVPEEAAAGLGTATSAGEAEEAGRNLTAEGKEGVPGSAPPAQPKLNGGQQPPAGVPTHFDPAFRSMMPPYVSPSPRRHAAGARRFSS